VLRQIELRRKRGKSADKMLRAGRKVRFNIVVDEGRRFFTTEIAEKKPACSKIASPCDRVETQRGPPESTAGRTHQ